MAPMDPLACMHSDRSVPVLDEDETFLICGLCATVLLGESQTNDYPLTIALAAPSDVLVSWPAEVTV